MGDDAQVPARDLHPLGHPASLSPSAVFAAECVQGKPEAGRKKSSQTVKWSCPSRKGSERFCLLHRDGADLFLHRAYFNFYSAFRSLTEENTALQKNMTFGDSFFFGLFISKIKIPGCGIKKCLTFICFGACGVHLFPRMQIRCSCSE